MTLSIPIPTWPFVVLYWLLIVLTCVTFVFFIIRMLVVVLKSKNLFRMARIYLTCEKWRKEANREVYDVLEDCMRHMAKDQPDSFHFMRERLLMLRRQPVTLESLIDELERSSEMASESDFPELSQSLSAMAEQVRSTKEANSTTPQ